MSSLLTVQDLCVRFVSRRKTVSQPLRGVNLNLGRGEILGIVGETGCGKTLTGLAILGALSANARVSGQICYEGQELTSLDEQTRAKLRGTSLALIPQNPAAALDPVHTIGTQLQLLARRHLDRRHSAAVDLIDSELAAVGLTDPERVRRSYPHELSGGMLQRVVIAAALLARPRLVVADEPTTALDVTIERQILNLIRDRQHQLGVSVVLVTHDIGVVESTCDKVAVLYAGRTVEQGLVADVLSHPSHPYTRGLLAALPRKKHGDGPLTAIPGSVPVDTMRLKGCAFADRCGSVRPDCTEGEPPNTSVGPGHTVECRYPEQA